MNATPRPWNCCSTKYMGLVAGIIRDEMNDPIADCRYWEEGPRDKRTHDEIDANARLIVHAVNSYDAMREALSLLETAARRYGNKLDDDPTYMLKLCVQAKAALALAKGYQA